MDLTKIVLPTFILERRSLLEMYADFFAHPDLFVEIPSKNTPEERIIQVGLDGFVWVPFKRLLLIQIFKKNLNKIPVW